MSYIWVNHHSNALIPIAKLKNKLLYRIIYLSFVFLVVLPVVYTLITALFTDDSFANNLKALKRDTFFLLAKSSGLAFIIAVLSTFFGTILGFLLYKMKVRFKVVFLK